MAEFQRNRFVVEEDELDIEGLILIHDTDERFVYNNEEERST